MNAVYVEITATRGSAPRDAGTAMRVTPAETQGTIGGGALEYQAIATARDLLARGGPELRQTVPLGPGLGQCCGGAVTLLFTRAPRPVDGPRFIAASGSDARAPVPLWIWGSGHVGRAMVAQTAPLGAFEITWVDTGPTRFPETLPAGVSVLPTADMPRLMAHAPQDAHHLIWTYSHDIDLNLCAAALRRGFASCGVIGSATKWARFGKRLHAMGLDAGAITCPIGDKSRGKHPDAIASGTLRALLAYPTQKEMA